MSNTKIHAIVAFFLYVDSHIVISWDPYIYQIPLIKKIYIVLFIVKQKKHSEDH